MANETSVQNLCGPRRQRQGKPSGDSDVRVADQNKQPGGKRPLYSVVVVDLRTICTLAFGVGGWRLGFLAGVCRGVLVDFNYT